jgi:hypothetical protein
MSRLEQQHIMSLLAPQNISLIEQQHIISLFAPQNMSLLEQQYIISVLAPQNVTLVNVSLYENVGIKFCFYLLFQCL